MNAPYLGVEGTVSQEVRLMDITPTVLGAVGNEPLKRSEGENLLRYVNNPTQPSMSCSLMGRQAPHQGGGAPPPWCGAWRPMRLQDMLGCVGLLT